MGVVSFDFSGEEKSTNVHIYIYMYTYIYIYICINTYYTLYISLSLSVPLSLFPKAIERLEGSYPSSKPRLGVSGFRAFGRGFRFP